MNVNGVNYMENVFFLYSGKFVTYFELFSLLRYEWEKNERQNFSTEHNNIILLKIYQKSPNSSGIRTRI